MLDSFVREIGTYITHERLTTIIRVAVILCVGFPLLSLIRRVTQRLIRDKLSAQSELLIQRAVYYSGLLIILISILNEFGFKLSALLGAAGVFGIAIGFASQTSISNIISGVFLISEKPFVIGDVIQIGQSMGEIVSIDLLSVKLRTPDNRFVRVPNETMIKTEVTNNTRYLSRRVTTTIILPHNLNLEQATNEIKLICASIPKVDQNKEPFIQLDSLHESGLKVIIGVWGNTDDYPELKNSLLLALSEHFRSDMMELSRLSLNSYDKRQLLTNKTQEKAGTNEYETQH